MGPPDGFAAFLQLRSAAEARPRAKALERLEGLGAPEDGLLDVDRFLGDPSLPLDANPFGSFLQIRPPSEVVHPEVAQELRLRSDVLKAKKQLLEVALDLELRACAPETEEETILRLRRLQKAQRYLLNPGMTEEALSGDEDEDALAQKKIVCQSPAHAKVIQRAEKEERRWSSSMMRRQAPPAVFTPTPSRPSTSYQDEVVLGPREAGSGPKKKDKMSASTPNLKTERAQELPPLCKRRPSYKTWEGDPVIEDAALVPLTGWFWKTRSWNINIFSKDQCASRSLPEMAAGGVVFGNGVLPLFSGSHLLSTGYFYSFKVDAVDEEHFPLNELRDLSFAFGVSFLPGGHRLSKNTMYAYEIPGSILIGYGKHVVDSGEWFTHQAWDPKSLELGDVVGLLVSPHGDLVVYVNGSQVLRVATSLTEGNRREPHPRRKALGPRRTLFPLLDLHGRVTRVSLLHGAAPNVSLLARNNTHEKNLNPLGVKAAKAFPVPGRSLPGIGKVVRDLEDGVTGFKEV